VTLNYHFDFGKYPAVLQLTPKSGAFKPGVAFAVFLQKPRGLKVLWMSLLAQFY